MNEKILRVVFNPMMPHEAADRLRRIARELSEVSLDEELEGTTPNSYWTWKLPGNDKDIG